MEILINGRSVNVSTTVLIQSEHLFPNNPNARQAFILQATIAELRHQKGEGLVIRPRRDISDSDFNIFDSRYK